MAPEFIECEAVIGNCLMYLESVWTAEVLPEGRGGPLTLRSHRVGLVEEDRPECIRHE